VHSLSTDAPTLALTKVLADPTVRWERGAVERRRAV